MDKNTLKSQIESHEDGASLVEYALLVALIALIAILAIRSVGQQTSANFSLVNTEIEEARTNN